MFQMFTEPFEGIFHDGSVRIVKGHDFVVKNPIDSPVATDHDQQIAESEQNVRYSVQQDLAHVVADLR